MLFLLRANCKQFAVIVEQQIAETVSFASWIPFVATFKRHLKTILFTAAYGVTDN